MQTKELQTGVPYVYSTGSKYKSFGSDGAMFVLSTDTYRTVNRPRATELPIVPCPSGKGGYMEGTGILVILFRNMNWSPVAEKVRKILSKVTLAQVEAAGMQIPSKVIKALDALDESVLVSLTVVLPRYLKGDWDTLSAQHEQDLIVAQAAAQKARAEAADRQARWEEISRVSEQMIGRKLSVYGSPSGHTTTVSLEYLEALLRVAQSTLRDGDAPIDL